MVENPAPQSKSPKTPELVYNLRALRRFSHHYLMRDSGHHRDLEGPTLYTKSATCMEGNGQRHI